jgi:hypothetical protein
MSKTHSKIVLPQTVQARAREQLVATRAIMGSVNDGHPYCTHCGRRPTFTQAARRAGYSHRRVYQKNWLCFDCKQLRDEAWRDPLGLIARLRALGSGGAQ